MSYIPLTWVEKVTKVGPTNLNHLETGLRAAADVADTANTLAAAALPTPGGSNGQFLKRVGGVWVPTSFAVTDIPSASIDQTYMAAGNKITSGAMASGPPGSPSTGDVWIATAVDSAGTVWMFRYDNSQTTFKWVFVGGTAAMNVSAASAAFASSTNYQNPNSVSLTNARQGDYSVRITGSFSSTDGSQRNMLVGVAAGAVNPGATGGISVINPFIYSFSRIDRLTSVAASTAIQPRYASSFATTLISVFAETLEIIPVRVI